MFKNALAFSLTAGGIPFVYYGSEQGFQGGLPPDNREPLWTDMEPDTDIYTMIAAINKARKAHKIWEEEPTVQYVLNDFYAFSRNDMLVAMTNSHEPIRVNIRGTLPATWSDGI